MANSRSGSEARPNYTTRPPTGWRCSTAAHRRRYSIISSTPYQKRSGDTRRTDCVQSPHVWAPTSLTRRRGLFCSMSLRTTCRRREDCTLVLFLYFLYFILYLSYTLSASTVWPINRLFLPQMLSYDFFFLSKKLRSLSHFRFILSSLKFFVGH